MKFSFHRDALVEYEEAARNYAKIEPELALRFVDAVERSIGLIIEAPERWRDIDDGIRCCFTRLFPYDILYLIESDYVLIVAVIHCSHEPGILETPDVGKASQVTSRWTARRLVFEVTICDVKDWNTAGSLGFRVQ